MANYPIKMLKDEHNIPFVPIVGANAIVYDDQETLEERLSKKLEKGNIIAGANISLSKSGNNITISSTGGGGQGTDDYRALTNKPKINNVELNGNQSLADLGIVIPTKTSELTNDSGFSVVTETGNKIDLSLNPTTYVMTLVLKDKNNNTLSTDTVDLPLETVVVSGRYDSATKKVILTLKNGSEIDFSVADLVSGLQPEITTANKLSSDLVNDSGHTNKFVTFAEKTTWNNKQNELVSGTNIKTINNQSILGSGNINIQGSGSGISDVKVNGTSIVSNNEANIVTNSSYDAVNNKIATMADIGSGEIIYVSPNILDLTSESTEAEIISAFGGATEMENVLNAIKQSKKVKISTYEGLGYDITTGYVEEEDAWEFVGIIPDGMYAFTWMLIIYKENNIYAAEGYGPMLLLNQYNYASSNMGGILNVRLDGTTLYIRNDGEDA